MRLVWMWHFGRIAVGGRELQLNRKPMFSFTYDELEYQPKLGLAFKSRDGKRVLLTAKQQQEVEAFVVQEFERLGDVS